MTKQLILILIAVFFISATATITVNKMVVQPQLPVSVKVLCGHIFMRETNELESSLSTYRNIGYVVKTIEYNSDNNYLVILEKYQ